MIFKNPKDKNLNKNLGKSQLYTGFTLAEVLITLGIIGVVAAMTIPTLMNQTNEAELRTAWKKAYSVFSQSYFLMKNDGTLTWSNSSTMRDAFANYFKAVKSCEPAGSDCWHAAGVAKTLPLPNGTQKDMNDVSINSGLITQDGMKIVFHSESDGTGWAMIDVNGDKKPNVDGKDIFGLRFGSKPYPFTENEMGTCNPPSVGAAGDTFVGMGCSTYYLMN